MGEAGKGGDGTNPEDPEAGVREGSGVCSGLALPSTVSRSTLLRLVGGSGNPLFGLDFWGLEEPYIQAVLSWSG